MSATDKTTDEERAEVMALIDSRLQKIDSLEECVITGDKLHADAEAGVSACHPRMLATYSCAMKLTLNGRSIAPWINWSACNDSVKAKMYHRLSTLTSVERDRPFLRNKAKKSFEFSACEVETWTSFGRGPSGAKAGAGAAEPKSRALETGASRLNRRLHGRRDALAARASASPLVEKLVESAGCRSWPQINECNGDFSPVTVLRCRQLLGFH